MKENHYTTAQILSISTGKLMSESIKDVYKILNGLLGVDIMTHEIPTLANEARPWILEACPWADIDKSSINNKTYKSILAEVESRVGTEHYIPPVPKIGIVEMRKQMLEKLKSKHVVAIK